MQTDVRTKTEESQYLRETLQRTKDKLEQEKRLNSAIKHKKTFHLENEGVSRGGWPRHQCQPEDMFGDVCTTHMFNHIKQCSINKRSVSV